LLKHLETPGLEVEQLLKRVTADVERATNGTQLPERLSRLKIELWLKGDTPVPKAEMMPPLAPEAQAWIAVQSSTSEAVLEEFIQRFPGGVYASFARARLEEVKRSKAASSDSATTGLPASSAPSPLPSLSAVNLPATSRSVAADIVD